MTQPSEFDHVLMCLLRTVVAQVVPMSKESAALISPSPPSYPEDSSAEGILDKVLPLVWSFLLDRSPEKRGETRVFDFKSIGALMLVNRSSKGAFDECLGWYWCSMVLKREAYIRTKLANSKCIELIEKGEGLGRRFRERRVELDWCDWAKEVGEGIMRYKTFTYPDGGFHYKTLKHPNGRRRFHFHRVPARSIFCESLLVS